MGFWCFYPLRFNQAYALQNSAIKLFRYIHCLLAIPDYFI